MTNGRTRVVVTGMGTVNPIGKSLEEYWHSLIEGRSGASPIERFPSERLATKFACQVNTFDPQDYLERKAAHSGDLPVAALQVFNQQHGGIFRRGTPESPPDRAGSRPACRRR